MFSLTWLTLFLSHYVFLVIHPPIISRMCAVVVRVSLQYPFQGVCSGIKVCLFVVVVVVVVIAVVDVIVLVYALDSLFVCIVGAEGAQNECLQ